ncbi:hypothetical protein AX16_001519 [Volvariella volvacea WC 439]|nr:hypothetical protein AX16_001519 [Volvariella volvacea WC 439]
MPNDTSAANLATLNKHGLFINARGTVKGVTVEKYDGNVIVDKKGKVRPDKRRERTTSSNPPRDATPSRAAQDNTAKTSSKDVANAGNASKPSGRK